MNTPLPMRDLVAELVHTYPSAQLELDPLPSGVCFLWVTMGGRNFAMEYHPTQGTGVSENTSKTTPFDGHENVYKTLSEAIAQFRNLLSTTANLAQTGGFAEASIN